MDEVTQSFSDIWQCVRQVVSNRCYEPFPDVDVSRAETILM